MKKIMIFILVFVLCAFGFVTPIFAFTVRGGENLNISENIADDVYSFSNVITLTGSINGDLVAAGSQINILGDVKGDLLAAGGTISINGEIGDTARLAGGMITVNNNFKKDLVAAGGQITVSQNALIDGDAAINAARIIISGNINKNVRLSASEVLINGKVGGTVEITASNITIGDEAEILGDLNYTSEKQASISSKAKIIGKTDWKKTEADSAKKIKISPGMKRGAAALLTTTWIAGKIIRFLSSFVMGLILLLVIPRIYSKYNERMKRSLGRCVGGGAIFLFGVPVAMVIIFIIGVILLITIIGSSLGGLAFLVNFLLLIAYILLLLVSNSFLSFFIGSMILQKSIKNRNKYGWRLLAFFIGLVITSIFFEIPFIGWLVQFAAILFGLGGLVMTIKDQLVLSRKPKTVD